MRGAAPTLSPEEDVSVVRDTVVCDGVRLLDGGSHAYPRMLSAIEQAHRSVYLEVYAFSPFGIGEAFIQALARAASRGVEVRVLIDGWGSAKGGRTVVNVLQRAGCILHLSNQGRSDAHRGIGPILNSYAR